MPANPLRDSTNVRSSGIASRSPAVVAMAISRAYWLCSRSCGTVPWSKSIRSAGMSPVAGSFMSFQMPARPDRTCSALRSPHHRRPSSVAKSGNVVFPGQTCPM